MFIFSFYLIKKETSNLQSIILEKGIASVQSGKSMMETILTSVVNHNIFTINEIFNQKLTPINLPKKITDQYKNISKENIKKIQKYHYETTFDSYLDNNIIKIQEQFLNDPQVVFAALVDNQGYLPTHNIKYSKKLTGNFIFDKNNNRTKRLFNEDVGLKAAQNFDKPYLKQIYKRDTGEIMWDISAPVFVKGKKWGAFRIGFSMEKTYAKIKNLKIKLIIFMICLLFAIILVIEIVTSYFLTPLSKLNSSVKKLAKGDFSSKIKVTTNDEIGNLAKTFNKMLDDIQNYINKLTETTKTKERIESELEIAHNIQQDILPKIFPAFPNREEFDIFAILEPAKQVGGDFYDFFFTDEEHLCTVIGDVSDKGVPASLFMAVTKTLIKTTAKEIANPKDILTKVNNELSVNNDSCMFVTVFISILNIKTGEIVYSNAGHNPPYIIDSENNIKPFSFEEDVVLGTFPDYEYKNGSFKLNKNDSIYFYTDGVTEALNNKEELFGEERLEKLITTYGSKDPKQLLNHSLKELQKFAENAVQSDDITIMILLFKNGE
jgi:serine phosphatase RsbU (regulator of sigma subunit)